MNVLQVMILTYVVNAGWLAMTYLCAMPILLFAMLYSVCQHEIYRRDFWFLDNYCINISRFGKLRKIQYSTVKGKITC